MRRAAQGTAGELPEQAIDRRIVLEGRRLLTHTVLPIGRIAHQVGFGDASNFASFFAHQTEEPPTRFRARERRAGSAAAEAVHQPER